MHRFIRVKAVFAVISTQTHNKLTNTTQ